MPTLALGNWPTPVRRIEGCSRTLGTEVWAKAEDGSGTWSGNKVRKLEYLLGDAVRRGYESVTTYGVGSSTWCAATARYATASGLGARMFLAGRVPDRLRELYVDADARVVELPGHPSLPLAYVAARARSVGSAALLPAGGSGGIGDLGSARAGAEIAASVAADEMPEPSTVFVAAGTGGTAAGLVVGLAASRLATRVVAVRVTPRPLGTRWLISRRIAALRSAAEVDAAPEPAFEIDARFHRPGYGRPNQASAEAAALASDDGLELDATYAAKAFAALVAQARAGRRGPLLLLDTSPSDR